MRIRFSEISPNGNRYEFNELGGIRDQEILSLGHNSKAEVVLVKKSDTQVELSGTIKAVPEIICDRCLEPFGYVLETSFHLLFEVSGKNKWRMREVECASEELDTIELDEPSIDLIEIIRQQILLSLPVKKICSTECKGICSYCGVNLNTESCRCSQQANNSPFAILAEYKKKQK
ncbi:YceD family protein [Desulfogranum japonicum]|uniref:YceD family protein n=1 Tax=Desulfogranum japonicum TaxID=231447 RepID=UPI0003F65507|nr:DUF177 domain-containing protein [Desulfogranum japonicum]